MKDKLTENLATKIDKKTKMAIEILADKENRTASQIIRFAIQEYIEKHTNEL